MQWLWLGLGGLAGDDIAACFFGVPCECKIPRMALSRGCCPGPARAREPDACAAARPRSDAPRGALGVPAAEQVRACGASLHLSLPDRERLPALYLLGLGHTGTSELYAQVVRHPSVISPRTYRGEPPWKAKENSMWKHEFDGGRGLIRRATAHAPGTVLVDGTPLSCYMDAPFRLSALFAHLQERESKRPSNHTAPHQPPSLPPDLQFILMLRDPLAIISSALKHEFTSHAMLGGCGGNPNATAHFLGVPRAALAEVLRLVREYNACASHLRQSGSNPSLVWPTCATAIRSACPESRLERAADGAGQLTPALVHDCGVGRQVSCSFVSDQRDWWLRFVPAAQLHVVHNSQLSGGAAAQLVWHVAGLNASSKLLAKRNTHNLGANVHSFEAMPPPVQTLISTLLTNQELRDALDGEVQRQAELMLV